MEAEQTVIEKFVHMPFCGKCGCDNCPMLAKCPLYYESSHGRFVGLRAEEDADVYVAQRREELEDGRR